MAGQLPQLGQRASTYFVTDERTTIAREDRYDDGYQKNTFLRTFTSMFSRGSIYGGQTMQWRNADPEASAGMISKLFFIWVQPLFTRAALLHARGSSLKMNDLLPISGRDKGGNVEAMFQEH